jgi:hypothetical protein
VLLSVGKLVNDKIFFHPRQISGAYLGRQHVAQEENEALVKVHPNVFLLQVGIHSRKR